MDSFKVLVQTLSKAQRKVMDKNWRMLFCLSQLYYVMLPSHEYETTMVVFVLIGKYCRFCHARHITTPIRYIPYHCL